MSMEIKNRPYSAETGTRRTGAAAAEKSKDRTGASGARAMDVDEYMSALSKKYSYFGRTTKIANVPTTVNVSPADRPHPLILRRSRARRKWIFLPRTIWIF